MCDNVFSILKEFRLILSPGEESEQMFIEDWEDTDMYFSFFVVEGENSNVSYDVSDSSHGRINVCVKKGWGG